MSKSEIVKASEDKALKEIGSELAKFAKTYGLPMLDMAFAVAGASGPWVEIAKPFLKFIVDKLNDNGTEDAVYRAGVLTECLNQRAISADKFDQLSDDRKASLIQRLTRIATETRQQDRIRLIVAATFGGSDDTLASADDLATAEWMEKAEDSKLTHLRTLCEDLFGSDVIEEIIPCPVMNSRLSTETQGACNINNASPVYESPCIKSPNGDWKTKWLEGLSWWSMEELSGEMFVDINGGNLITRNDNQVGWWSHAENESLYWKWPSPMLQRIHNAFARERESQASAQKLWPKEQHAGLA